jgi:hypothetical protein
MLSRGGSSSAFAILRVLFEEIISMRYFLVNPDAARSALTDEKYIEPKLEKKIQAVTKEPAFSLISKHLSEGHVHPRINRISGVGDASGFTPEPIYNPDMAHMGLDFLIILLERAVRSMRLMAELQTAEELSENMDVFLADSVKYVEERIAENGK